MADARGEYWYFEPEVDASKITVPELRSILLKHNVTYPASAKKSVLVGLFNEQVLPQSAKLQRAYSRIKPSSRGIEDVPSSTASTTTDDAEDETILPPVPRVRKASRRITRSGTEEAMEKPAPTRRTKAPSSTVPNKHAREVETDIGDRPAVRRSRKSDVPTTRDRSSDYGAGQRNDTSSPFTQDNPFQSGSSPAAPDSRERRRKTMGFEQKEKQTSEVSRRRTIQPQVEQHDAGIVVPSRKSFEAPAFRGGKKAEKLTPPHDTEEDAGEEFAPEEQLELVRERAKNGELDILPPRRRKQHSKAAGTAKAFSLTLLTTALAVFGGVWRQEKYVIGFCGIGRDQSSSLAGVDIPEFANALIPRCEPCPPHATCYPDLRVTCDTDFVRSDHPLSLGGLIPLPPTCEADTEKTRRVTSVANRAVQILRKRRADYECKESDADGNVLQSPDISAAELKEELQNVKPKSMSNAAFEDLFAKALGETALREEIIESSEGTSGGRTFSSTSLANLPLICSIRRSVRESLERHILTIALIFFAIISGLYGKYSITLNRTTEARAKLLASDVFDRLANQAALAQQEPGIYQDRGLSMNQLRDDVLRAEFSASRRAKLWQRVQKKVEHNSNIRAAVREGQSGDITRMWEWVGPVQLIEDGRSSGKRDGGRFSIGWGQDSSAAESKGTKEVQHWDEGRPIY